MSEAENLFNTLMLPPYYFITPFEDEYICLGVGYIQPNDLTGNFKRTNKFKGQTYIVETDQPVYCVYLDEEMDEFITESIEYMSSDEMIKFSSGLSDQEVKLPRKFKKDIEKYIISKIENGKIFYRTTKGDYYEEKL